MSVYETIGVIWVVFTSVLASAAVLYLAYVGLRVVVRDSAQYVTVRLLPVSWGSKEHERTVNVRV